MKTILITYATMAGSTAEVAQTVADEVGKRGVQVKVLPLREVKDIEAFDGVVIGAPMIMGWHREALGFLKKHRKALQHIPIAIFVMAMSLTQTNETVANGVSVYVDENLPKLPKNESKLSFREGYARLSKYLKPILSAISPGKPASIGVFGGRLEYGRLKWWAVLFAMLIIQAPAGERRNWSAIRAWAKALPAAFHLEAISGSESEQTSG
jgi:menaquinone-dependent protoporphyrinogen oxidase